MINMQNGAGPVRDEPSGEPECELETLAGDIDAITEEILEAKKVGGRAVMTIGRKLIEAKSLLKHGEWLPWLNEKVEFSERSAQNFMRLYKNYSKSEIVADLGARKALTLLALPESEREAFAASAHEVNGEEKTVADMTARELEQAIRDRDEARAEADKNRQAWRGANERAKEWEGKAGSYEKELARVKEERREQKTVIKTLQDKNAETSGRITELCRELNELKSRPVEVAVQVDETAVKQAQAERDNAKAAQMEAETARKFAEADARAHKENESLLQKENDSLRRELEQARAVQGANPFEGDDSLAQFKFYFEQMDETANRLRGLVLKVRNQDAQAAETLEQALAMLADKLRGVAA